MQSTCSRQVPVTTPAAYHSIFTGRMLYLTLNQQRQSPEGILHHLTTKISQSKSKQRQIICKTQIQKFSVLHTEHTVPILFVYIFIDLLLHCLTAQIQQNFC